MLLRFQVRDLGEVAVNGQGLWAATASGETSVRLLWDSSREIIVEGTIAAMTGKLGAAFKVFEAVGDGAGSWLINSRQVLAVVPHPQHAGVCFLQGQTRRLAVQGDLDSVLARL